jgi:hypothetical protein
MMLPAGDDDASGDAFYVARVDWAAKVVEKLEDCRDMHEGQSTHYFLLVARAGRIARVQFLVDAGEMCMRWRDEQIAVSPNLFVWRDAGWGAPTSKEDHERWKDRHWSFELSTLRVNGCAAPAPNPGVPIVQNGW